MIHCFTPKVQSITQLDNAAWLEQSTWSAAAFSPLLLLVCLPRQCVLYVE